jgi:hypothetical protein
MIFVVWQQARAERMTAILEDEPYDAPPGPRPPVPGAAGG